MPAAAAFRARQAGKGVIARQMVNWQHTLEGKWKTLRFGEVKSDTKGDQRLFEVQVYLGEVSPDAVRVELYADAANDGQAIRVEMKRARPIADAVNCYLYTTSVPASRRASDYTARVLPHYDGITVPLEASCILWQR